MEKKRKEKSIHIAELDMRTPEVQPHGDSIRKMREKPHLDKADNGNEHSQNTTTHD